jgi:hypothetical protein
MIVRLPIRVKRSFEVDREAEKVHSKTIYKRVRKDEQGVNPRFVLLSRKVWPRAVDT